MMRALVTAFEPFGGDRTNASQEAIRRLPARHAGIEIVTAILPTSFGRAHPALIEALNRLRPDIILCVGQASERTGLSVERVAINIQDARIADNDGAMPIDTPVLAGAPAAYFSTLPIKAIAAALSAEKLPAAISNSAGTFVCNHVFFGLMHHVALHAAGARAGLLHVPRADNEAAADAPSGGNDHAMTPGDLARGILIVLEVTARPSDTR